MCTHFFARLLHWGGDGSSPTSPGGSSEGTGRPLPDPLQKTIIFCASDHHADHQEQLIKELKGLDALKQGGQPAELLRKTKETLFAA